MKLIGLVKDVVLIAAVLLLGFLLLKKQPAVSPNPGGQTVPLQAIIKAIELVGATRGSTSIIERPAVTVFRELVPGTSKMSDAQIAAFLSALGKPKTVPVVNVTAKMVAPTPYPVAAADQHLFDVAKNADLAALNESHIAVKADVTYQEVPVSRIGSVFATDGSAGLGYAVVRRKQLDLEAVITMLKGKAEGGGGIVWRIPHTQAGVGGGVLVSPPSQGQALKAKPVALFVVNF